MSEPPDKMPGSEWQEKVRHLYEESADALHASEVVHLRNHASPIIDDNEDAGVMLEALLRMGVLNTPISSEALRAKNGHE